MTVTLHYASGSPYAWRAWLALEHKGAPYELKTHSFDGGDLRTAEFAALNPRRRVPVIVDDGFVLYESAAIVEYVEERWPQAPRLFDADLRRRAVQRRLVREADQYLAEPMERLVEAVLFTPVQRREPAKVAAVGAALGEECARWEALIEGEFLTGAVSAADYALYPLTALIERIGARNPGTVASDIFGPTLSAWMARMRAAPIVSRTWPPHWR